MRTEVSSPAQAAAAARSAPDAAASWAALAELLLTCSTALRDELSARSQCVALSGPQFALLWACECGNGGLSQRELALRLSLSAAHVSGLVEHLSGKQLIIGERAANDRRRQIWRLTDQGRDAVRQVLSDWEPFVDRLNSHLSTNSRQQLEVILQKLATALRVSMACEAFAVPMAGGAA